MDMNLEEFEKFCAFMQRSLEALTEEERAFRTYLMTDPVDHSVLARLVNVPTKLADLLFIVNKPVDPRTDCYPDDVRLVPFWPIVGPLMEQILDGEKYIPEQMTWWVSRKRLPLDEPFAVATYQGYIIVFNFRFTHAQMLSLLMSGHTFSGVDAIVREDEATGENAIVDPAGFFSPDAPRTLH